MHIVEFTITEIEYCIKTYCLPKTVNIPELVALPAVFVASHT